MANRSRSPRLRNSTRIGHHPAVQNIADQLRAFRLKELAKIVPPGPGGSTMTRCEGCGAPARLAVGRRTGIERIVPVGCHHWTHRPGEQPVECVPDPGIITHAARQLAERAEMGEGKGKTKE